jgi:hypothetical protein
MLFCIARLWAYATLLDTAIQRSNRKRAYWMESDDQMKFKGWNYCKNNQTSKFKQRYFVVDGFYGFGGMGFADCSGFKKTSFLDLL